MMKLLLGTLVVVLLIASACGNAAPAQCPPGQITNMISSTADCCPDANSDGQCDTAEPKQQPPVVVVEPAVQQPVVINPPPQEEPKAEPAQPAVLPAEMKTVADLRARAQEKVKSYSYTYGDVSYKVLGDTVRVELGRFFRPDSNNAANVVYLNLKTKTAEAYCEGGPTVRRMCDLEQRGPFPVEFGKYVQKLPMQWLDELADAAVVKITPNAQAIGSSKTDRWDVTADGKTISFWVLANYGIPVRVMTPDAEHNYAGMSVNTLKAEEMVPHPDVRV